MRKEIEVWQDNVLTEARYEMSETEKNILYMLVAGIQKGDPPTKMYEVSVKEIAAIAGSEEMMYAAYQQATRKLATRLLEVKLPNGDLLQTTFIASAQYKKGYGIIELELSQKVRPFYVELNERFTKFQLQAAISLKSFYAKRIYELLCMFKNMTNKTFGRKLVDLKTMLGVIDSKTGKDTYSDWTKFKRNVLDVADKEINGFTDLTFTYEPVYGQKAGRGRKPVEQVKFTVQYYKAPADEHVLPIVERLIRECRLRRDQAHEVVEKYDIPTIHRQIYDILSKFRNGEVRSLGAYSATVFGLTVSKKPKKGTGEAV